MKSVAKIVKDDNGEVYLVVNDSDYFTILPFGVPKEVINGKIETLSDNFFVDLKEKEK